MGTPWSDANIVRFLVIYTTGSPLVGESQAVVRYEALIIAMHATVQIIPGRFEGRARSLITGYFTEMGPHLVAAGLPASRIEDHLQSRFAEYDPLLNQWLRASGQNFALTGLATLFAAYTAGCKPEEVELDAVLDWEVQYYAFWIATADTIDQTILRPGFMARLWRGLRMIFRGN